MWTVAPFSRPNERVIHDAHVYSHFIPCLARPDYTDPATCGALMAWCHRELEQAIAATHKPLRPRFNVARVALNEARPWDGDSVRRAVEAVCEVVP